MRKARVPCLRQPRVEQHAIQLGTNRRFLSTAHILLSSCVFAASARPPHTSVVMQLRVRRPVWSPTGPARRAASGARRPAVHSERTNRTRNGHMVSSGQRRDRAGAPCWRLARWPPRIMRRRMPDSLPHVSRYIKLKQEIRLLRHVKVRSEPTSKPDPNAEPIDGRSSIKAEKQSAHSNFVSSVAFSPDGKSNVSGNNNYLTPAGNRRTLCVCFCCSRHRGVVIRA